MDDRITLGKMEIMTIRKKLIVLFVSIFFYFAGLMFFLVYNIYGDKENIYDANDKILINTASKIPDIIGKKFHDKIIDGNSVSHSIDFENITRLEEYSESMNAVFTFTVINFEGTIVFTSANSAMKEFYDQQNDSPEVNKTSELEYIKGNYIRYFEEYGPRKPALKKYFDDKKPSITEYTVGKKKIRSAVVPFVNNKGMSYLSVAGKSSDYYDSLVFKSIITTLIFCLIFSILIFPLFIIQYINLKNELKSINERIYHDYLTKLPNRNRLNEDLLQAETPNIFQINIDSLKNINDYYGYDAGDFIIKEMANRILFFLVSDEYSLYKLESDEYAILLEKSISRNEANTLARFFIESISEKPYIYNDNEIHITVTIGAALSCCGKENSERCGDLLIFSDLALEKAVLSKKSFFIYDQTSGIKNDYENNVMIIKTIKESIMNDSVIPFFQPILNNQTGRIEKYESLIRIRDGDKILSPARFLDISKWSKFYHKLTRIILHKVFENLKEYDFEFSLNLSIKDILDDETNIFLMLKLNEYREHCHKIVFELLESEGIENYDEVKEFIDIIKEYDCKIAIDDFGSGYSNYGHLIKLNVDYIKLDAMIVRNIDTDRNNEIIARNINTFAHELGIKTIAEFVHSERVLGIVRDLGIDYSQGFYIGSPVEIIGK